MDSALYCFLPYQICKVGKSKPYSTHHTSSPQPKLEKDSNPIGENIMISIADEPSNRVHEAGCATMHNGNLPRGYGVTT